jgi:hypothetical protein
VIQTIFLASPAIFERLNGHPPLQPKSDAVIGVQTYPWGTVF